MVNMQGKKVKIKQKTTETYEKIMEVDDTAKDLLYTELDWDT